VKELADGVYQLDGFPPDLLNVYLIGDVLIDAASRYDGGRILKQLRGREVTAHALTHAHPDHLGSSHEVCQRLNLDFWVGAADAPTAEDPGAHAADVFRNPFTGGRLLPPNPFLRLLLAAQAGPGHPVARTLKEGDDVGGFTVLETPGHTPGHVAFWRESDRVLIAGDVVWNFRFLVGLPGMTEPLPISTPDPARNRASARRLAELEPALVCFGHGPPLRDTAKFAEFVSRLPDP
jgi:glyoxylase-like metal-dependent hydrolase (beta-lactamase superfamily II)